jgi:ribonucleoside-diphosphate reductase alpha chain
MARGEYRLVVDGATLLDDVTKKLDAEEEALTRMTSTALRHGADIGFVVHQLEKVEGDMSSFSKSISRSLKKYIENGVRVFGETCVNCGNIELHRSEGCVTCKNCGWSKCS